MCPKVSQISGKRLKKLPKRRDRSCDIIRSCHGRYLNHVLEQIWLALDYESIINALRVSTSWQSTVNDVDLWLKFLQKQLSTNSDWRRVFNILGLFGADPELLSDESCCQQICNQICTHIQRLEKNLRAGRFARTIVPLPLSINHDIICVSMNDRYFVTAHGNGEILIWNRSTMTASKAFNNHDRIITVPIGVKIDSNLVVCATYDSKFFIWDIENDVLTIKEIEEYNNISKFEFKNNLIFTQKEDYFPIGENLMNVYRITDNLDIRRVFRKYFKEPYVLDQFVIDENYLILLIGNSETYPSNLPKLKIVVMCSRTLRTLRSSSEIKHHPMPNTLSCVNGWVVVATRWNEIRLFDVKTLICRHIYRETFDIEHLTISRDFLISRNRAHTIKIWDFRSMCSGAQQQKNATASIYKKRGSWCPQFQFDGMQLITCDISSKRTDLIVADFLDCTSKLNTNYAHNYKIFNILYDTVELQDNYW